MSKYYTPEIEEFHVGFEYEIKRHGVWGKETWSELLHENYNVDIQHNDPTEVFLESDDWIRVKYLDREDIESLGCKLIGKKDNGSLLFEKEYICKRAMEMNNAAIYFVALSNHILIYNDSGETMFTGTVKNKSELKRILKMIGV